MKRIVLLINLSIFFTLLGCNYTSKYNPPAIQEVQLIKEPDYGMFNWSPDNNHFAFSPHHIGRNDIYLYSIQNETIKELYASAGYDFLGGWSPDSREIVFASDDTGQFEIYTLAVDTSSTPYKVPTNTQSNRRPRWTTSNNQIVFLGGEPENYNIFYTNDELTEPVQLTKQSQNITDFAVSVSGEKIAYVVHQSNEFSDLHILFIDGGKDEIVVKDMACMALAGWSPISDDVAFTTCSDSPQNARALLIGHLEDHQLNIVDTELRLARHISNVWSPNGENFIFTDFDENGIEQMFTMNLQQKQLMTLTDSRETDSFYPIWSPNGKFIVYSTLAKIVRATLTTEKLIRSEWE